MAFPKIKIADGDGNVADVTSNRLDVNAYLSATPTIDIGDVSIKSGDGTAITDTVSGRLDVTLDSTSTGHLSEIEGAVETIEGAVSGSEMQVDIVSSPTLTVQSTLQASDGTDIGDVDVASNVHPAAMSTIITYAQFDVGTSAIQLSSSDGINTTVTDCKEIIIQADNDNAGYVVVGDSGVTADTEGIRINAGDTIVLPIASTATPYLRADQASQNVNVMVMK